MARQVGDPLVDQYNVPDTPEREEHGRQERVVSKVDKGANSCLILIPPSPAHPALRTLSPHLLVFCSNLMDPVPTPVGVLQQPHGPNVVAG